MDKYIKELEKKYKGVTFEFNDNFSKAGVCYYNNKHITLSKPIFKHNTQEGRHALVEHEILHLDIQNHSKEFHQELARRGYSDNSIMRVTRYNLICPHCRNNYFVNRLNKKTKYLCDKCHTKGIKTYMVLYKYDPNQS